MLFDSPACFSEPINTFHGIHQNNDEPIRVSYHRNIHYNSVVNPNKATIGVGLGLPAFKPGVSAHGAFQMDSEFRLQTSGTFVLQKVFVCVWGGGYGYGRLCESLFLLAIAGHHSQS